MEIIIQLSRLIKSLINSHVNLPRDADAILVKFENIDKTLMGNATLITTFYASSR